MLNREKAAGLLRHAADLVSGPRAQTHDPEGVQMDVAAKMITAFLGVEVTASDVCFIQSLIKMSRAKVGDDAHDDHYTDAAAYAAMAGAMEPEIVFAWKEGEEKPGIQGKNVGFDMRSSACFYCGAPVGETHNSHCAGGLTGVHLV